MGSHPKFLVTVLAVALLGSGCGRQSVPAPPPTPASDYVAKVRDHVTVEAMMAHLSKLQAIAYAHDGNRALGTPGFADSAEYVADALRSKGFDVQMPEFELQFPFADPPMVTVGGST